jgi:dsDNA-binding SOS-regulon protein
MDRRRSPKYAQHNVSIPKELSTLIRMLCASERKTLGEATEEALSLWINLQKEKIANLAKTKEEVLA